MAVVRLADIQGIGPVLEAKMNALGLFTSGDLLRSDRRRLAEELVGTSVEQIRAWQSVSELLELDEITLAIAQAFHDQGVESLDEMGRMNLTRLRTVVAAIRANGTIGTSVTDDQAIEWSRDAILLRHTGTLNGTVTGRSAVPVADAEVSCMGIRTSTDARGRFRIRRLPLGSQVLVHFEHEAYTSKSVSTKRVAMPNVLLGATFRLTEKRTPSAKSTLLSELEGDQLPRIRGAAVTTKAQTTLPSQHDLLRVVEVDQQGQIQLASRLLNYENGRFVVRTYRMANATVEGRVVKGTHLRYVSGRWQAVEMSGHAIEGFRRNLRLAKLKPIVPANATPADRDRAMVEFHEALIGDRRRQARTKENTHG